MKQTLLLSALCFCTAVAAATIYVEDFEYPQPTENMWTTDDGIFTHRITTDSTWEFAELTSTTPPSGGQALALWPASDTITFNLHVGDYVNKVNIDYVWLGGTTQIRLLTESGFYTLDITGDLNIWKTFTTTGLELGSISRIDLMSNEGAFDNISINVVPEPATLVLLVVGVAAMLRQRK